MNEQTKNENGIRLTELSEDVLGEVTGGRIKTCTCPTGTGYTISAGDKCKHCDPVHS
jgi:predicted methyltransferase